MDMDPSQCNVLEMFKNHLFYLLDLFLRFNEVQKHLQGKYVPNIQVRTILISFLFEIGLFRSLLAQKIFKLFKFCSNYKKMNIFQT